jgi:DNA-binding transcriptional LysR family regulator
MLRALHLLLEQRSLSSVAREIGMSQPALSHALARMREMFDDQLLVRERNTMVPTARALQIQEQLRAIMPDLQRLFSDRTFDPAESRQIFKLAITDHAGQVLIPEFLRRLTSLAPHVEARISLIPNRQTDVVELDQGQFDTRVGWLRSLPPNWLKRKLCDDSIVVIGATDNPVFAPDAGGLTEEHFQTLSWVALEAERPIYPNMIDSVLAERGAGRNIVARVSHFSIVPFIVSRSQMVAMFPHRLARKFAERGVIAMAKPPIAFADSNLSVAWHPRVDRDPGHAWIRKLLVECAEDLVAQDESYSGSE